MTYTHDDIDAARRAANLGDAPEALERFLVALDAAAQHPDVLVKFHEAYAAVHTNGPAPTARRDGDGPDFPLPFRLRALLDTDTAYASPREVESLDRQVRGIVRNLLRLVADPAALLDAMKADAANERPDMRRARRAEWAEQLRAHRNRAVDHAEEALSMAYQRSRDANNQLASNHTEWNDAAAKGATENVAAAERLRTVASRAYNAAHRAYVDASGTPDPDAPTTGKDTQ